MRILDNEVWEPISNGTLERMGLLPFPDFFCDEDSGDNVMILLLGVKIEENNHIHTRYIPIRW